jgi:ABC-type Fe3+ transport system substrate-binding protein
LSSFPEIRKNPNLGYVVPTEGSPMQSYGLHVVKSARNPIGAQLLINFLLSDPIQSRLAQEIFTTPVNKHTKLDEEISKLVPFGPEGLKKFVALDNTAIAANYGKYREQFNAKINVK